mmetsp:Transcript_101202/g.179724  ORF Transcript_101202/g.179724 Transcript_101202/m.179724 type:complete len:125 (+) Transcript_101202:240-614(+)
MDSHTAWHLPDRMPAAFKFQSSRLFENVDSRRNRNGLEKLVSWLDHLTKHHVNLWNLLRFSAFAHAPQEEHAACQTQTSKQAQAQTWEGHQLGGSSHDVDGLCECDYLFKLSVEGITMEDLLIW